MPCPHPCQTDGHRSTKPGIRGSNPLGCANSLIGPIAYSNASIIALLCTFSLSGRDFPLDNLPDDLQALFQYAHTAEKRLVEVTKMPSSYDFAILGAGIAGVSAAYFLSKTAKVALIEREDSWGYHASGRSAAVFIEGYENPTVSKLTQDSKDFLLKQLTTSAITLSSNSSVQTVVPTDQTNQAHALTVQSLNPCLAFIEQSDALNRIPILRAEGLAGAIWDPNLLSIDTHQLMQGLLRAFFSNGGELLCGKTATLQRRARRDWAIDAHGLAVKTPIVINAAGAWANEVALMADQAPLPLVPNRRTAVVIKMEHGAPDWPMLRTMDQQLYVKPEEPGLMLSPQDETPSEAMDAQPDELI